MGSFWLNIAIGPWHIQVEYGSLRLRLSKNEHYKREWGLFRLCELAWPWPSTPKRD